MFRKFRAGGRQPGLRAGLESIGMPCRLHRLPMGIHEIWTSKLLFGHMLKWADVCWKEHLRKTAAYIWWEKPWCSWTVFSKSNMKEKRHHSGNCLCSQVSKHKARIPELLLGTGVVDEHYNGERFPPMGIYLKTKESGWPWGSIVFFKERDETLQIALQIPMLYIGLCTWWQWTQGKKKSEPLVLPWHLQKHMHQKQKVLSPCPWLFSLFFFPVQVQVLWCALVGDSDFTPQTGTQAAGWVLYWWHFFD